MTQGAEVALPMFVLRIRKLGSRTFLHLRLQRFPQQKSLAHPQKRSALADRLIGSLIHTGRVKPLELAVRSLGSSKPQIPDQAKMSIDTCTEPFMNINAIS